MLFSAMLFFFLINLYIYYWNVMIWYRLPFGFTLLLWLNDNRAAISSF